MSQNPVTGHGGRQGSVSVAELLARYDQPVAANRRTAHRAAAVGGGSAVLLALVAGAMTLSGQQPDAGQPAAAMPGPDHISGSSVTLLDSAVAPAAAPERMWSAAPRSGDRERHVPDRAAPVGETGNGQPGGGEIGNGQSGNGQPGGGETGNGQPGDASARSSEPSGRSSEPAAGRQPQQDQPAQHRAETTTVDETSDDSGLLDPVTGLVSNLTDPLTAS